jgi:hypothetical protein
MRSEEEIRRHRDDLRVILAGRRPDVPLGGAQRDGYKKAEAVEDALSWVLAEDDGGDYGYAVEMTGNVAASLRALAGGGDDAQ